MRKWVKKAADAAIAAVVLLGFVFLVVWLGTFFDREAVTNAINVIIALMLIVLGWLAAHWFEALVLLFMFRVWIGLSFITKLMERAYIALVNDDLAELLREAGNKGHSAQSN